MMTQGLCGTYQQAQARYDDPPGCAQTESPILGLLSRVKGRTSELHDALNALNVRLTAVLLPVPPTPENDKAKENRKSQSSVFEQLIEIEVLTGNAVNRIAAMMENLQV